MIIDTNKPLTLHEPYYMAFFNQKKEAVTICVRKPDSCQKECRWWKLCLAKGAGYTKLRKEKC